MASSLSSTESAMWRNVQDPEWAAEPAQGVPHELTACLLAVACAAHGASIGRLRPTLQTRADRTGEHNGLRDAGEHAEVPSRKWPTVSVVSGSVTFLKELRTPYLIPCSQKDSGE